MPIPSRASLWAVGCLVIVTLSACGGSQSQPLSVSPYEIVELVPGVWAALANPGGTAVGNAGIMNMGKTAVVFDTGLTPEAGRQIHTAVKQLTGNNVRFVLNSNHRDDHVGGNQIFEGSSLFSTSTTQQLVTSAGSRRSKEAVDQAREVLATLEERLAGESDPSSSREISVVAGYLRGIVESEGEFQRTPPTVVYDHRINFSDSLRRVKFIPTGTGSVEGEAVLWLEADSILFASDLVATDRHPRMQDGDIDGWMAALDTLLTLEFNILVPGHGPVGDRQSVIQMQDYLRFVDQAAQEATRGTPLDEIPIDSTFAGWMLESQFRENVRFVMEKRQE